MPKTTMKTKKNAHPPSRAWRCNAKPNFLEIASLDFHVGGNTIAGNGLPQVRPWHLREVLNQIDT
jgi:hypothetical protein